MWGAHLLMVLAVVATSLLGWWQWTVSQGHKADQSASLAHARPVPLRSVMGHNDAFPGAQTGRPAVLEGVWVPSGTVYVGGHQGGYWVATPLAIGSSATDPAIYVVRGWVARAGTAPAAPTGSARLVGWMQPPENGGLTDDDPNDDVLPELAVADALNHVKQDLYSGYAVVADAEHAWPAADAAVNDGTAGLTPAQPNTTPKAGFTTGLRNALYAFEWWVFGLFAIYIWWRYVRDASSSDRSADDEGEAEKPTQEDAVRSGS